MLPLNGHWIFICQKTEFHLKDGVCFCVYRRGGFFPNHVAIGWGVRGIIGPPKRRGEDPIQIGDSLLLGKNGEIFYTPPIDTIQRAKRRRPQAPLRIKPRPLPSIEEQEATH